MRRTLINPPLQCTFDFVYRLVKGQHNKMTPTLITTGGVPFEAEAKEARDGRRFISLPHNNRIYEHDWGYMCNSMGETGQRIGQYSVPLDEWAHGLLTFQSSGRTNRR
jgi:hypothetical protein